MSDDIMTSSEDLYRTNRRQLDLLKGQPPREMYGVRLDFSSMELWYATRYGREEWVRILSTRPLEQITQDYIDTMLRERGQGRTAENNLYRENRRKLDVLQKQPPRTVYGILLDYNQMETWYVAHHGIVEWHQILSTKTLEQIIQDYINEQLKAQKARNARQASNGGTQASSAVTAAATGAPNGAVPVTPHPDEDDDILYVPLSTLTEQELLDERRRQDTTRVRRQEIDDTLEAIQDAREQALEEGLYFGEETAEDIARRMRGSRARGGNDSTDGPAGTSSSSVAPVPVVIPEWGGEPGEPGGPGIPHYVHHGTGGITGGVGDYGAGGPSGGHDMDFDPFFVMEGLNDDGRDTGDGQQGRDTGDGQQGRDTGSGQRGTSSGSPVRSDGEDDGAIDPVPSRYGPEGAAEGELPTRPESAADDGGESDGPSEAPHISGNGLSQNPASGEDDEAAESDGEADGDESVRNSLNDDEGSLAGGPGSLLEDNPVADAAKQAAKKKMRLLVMHALSIAAPFIIGLLFVVMIVACINDKLGGGSGSGSTSGTSTTATTNAAAPTMDTGASGGSSGNGGGGSGTASGAGGTGASGAIVRRRQKDNNLLPNVNIDYRGLNQMFNPSKEDEGEEINANSASMAMAKRALEVSHSACGTNYLTQEHLDAAGISGEYQIYTKEKCDAEFGPTAFPTRTDDGRLSKKDRSGDHNSWGKDDPVPSSLKQAEAFNKWIDEHVAAGKGPGRWYACCSCFTAHLIADADIDNHPSAVAAEQAAYFRSRPDLWEVITIDGSKELEQQCQPGDIINTPGHSMIWVSNDLARKQFPGTTGNCVEAGQESRTSAGVTCWGKGSAAELAKSGGIIARAKGDASGGGGTISDGAMTANQRAVVNACGSVPSPGAGFCAGWVTNVYSAAGVGWFGGNADDMYNAYCTSSNKSDLKPGMLVAVSTHSHTAAGSIYGHIGIYTGNGMMMDNVGDIRTISVDEWIDYYSTTVPVKWGFGPGLP